MRQEDKEVDGPDLERAEERKRETELVEEDDEELYDLDGQNDHERDQGRNGSVISAMKTILAGEQIVVNDLKLPKRELIALEALHTATRGRDGQLDQFVYAEDRRTLLEQALAMLQPDIQSLAELGKPYEEMMQQVSELRSQLNVLQDAQDEVSETHGKDAAKTESDSDDKPEDHPEANDASLDGPERTIAKPASTLDGPERTIAKPASTLGGPRKGDPRAKESLILASLGPAIDPLPSGPERTIDKPASALSGGPELKPPAEPATTLGDPAEIAESEKKLPSWRRPSGG